MCAVVFNGGWDDTSAPNEIVQGLYLGGINEAQNLEKLEKLKISCILNMTEFEDKSGEAFYTNKKHALHRYKGIKSTDVDDYQMSQHFEETFSFIEESLKGDRRVLVHCAAGVSRSATIVAAYLMKKNNWSAEKSLRHIQTKRQIILPNIGFINQLISYQ